MRRHALPLLAIVGALALAACGSDAAKQAATASPGDAFCTAADKVNADSDSLTNVMFSGTPAEVEAAYTRLLGEAQAALKVAPKDIEDVIAKNVANEVKLGEALKQFNWDFLKAAQDPATKAMFESSSADSKAIDDYLTSKCGIAPDSTDGSSAPVTLAGLSNGEAVDKMVDLYAVNTGSVVTDEQRACVHTELDATFSVDALNAILSGVALDPAAQEALGQSLAKCGLS